MLFDGSQFLGLCQTKVVCVIFIITLNLLILSNFGVLPKVKLAEHFDQKWNTTLDNNTLATKENTILFWTFNYFSNGLGLDRQTDMVHFDCGNYRCSVTKNRTYLKQSHVIIFNPRVSKGTDLPPTVSPWQRWVVQTFESPVHETIPVFFTGKANWTFTYHTKSEIQWLMGFYVPHGKYDDGPYFFPGGNAGEKYRSQLKATSNNFAIKRNKKEKEVLWMVSNCGPKKRKAYVEGLRRNGLSIDIFGRCGKPDPCKKNTTCINNMFTKYYFYLAFENSRCEDYISEKTWKSLKWGLVPIVLGPSIQDYERKLPPNSFIHVDNFTSPAKLAQHVNYLLNNKDAYKTYHEWRKTYEIIIFDDHQFLWVCDVCKKIHNPPKTAHSDLYQWWKPNVQCKV